MCVCVCVCWCPLVSVLLFSEQVLIPAIFCRSGICSLEGGTSLLAESTELLRTSSIVTGSSASAASSQVATSPGLMMLNRLLHRRLC